MRCFPTILAALALTIFAHAVPPVLRVSENGHFLVTEKGAPVFLLADTAWSLVNRLRREEITSYLQTRREQQFNAVTFVLYSTGDPNQADAGTNGYGQPPFLFKDNRPDPTQPRLTPGAEPARPAEYDYWDHVDFALAEAKRLGLYAIVLPCWGSAVAGGYDGRPSADAIFDAANARAYGRWLGARYRDEPHVLWMPGGDRSAVYEKIGADYRPVFRAMAEGLREGGGGAALLSFHPQKRAPQSGDWFHGDAWLSFNSIQHWPEDQLAAIARDWKAAPPKPTWIFEGRYEGYYKKPYQAAEWGEWQMRQQAWQTVFAGAFGHTYGHERVFGFGKDGWDWHAELAAPGARSMRHLATFMAALSREDFLSRVPDQSLLDGDEGKAERLKSNRLTASRNGPGTQAMIYSANGRPIRVKLEKLAPGKASASWFNPRTGHWKASGAGNADGAESDARKPAAQDIPAGPGAPVREFAPPTHGDGEDWVLVVRSDGK